MNRNIAISWTLVLASVLWSVFSYWGTPSPDLMATWMAGRFYAVGDLAQIYPQDAGVYTMLPPSAWWPLLQSEGYSDPVFPFVYPPLWAALMAPLTGVLNFSAVQSAAAVVNPALLGATVVLAGRMVRGPLPLWAFTAIGLLILHLTLPGIIALDQDQPQIGVSFLIVLALERQWAGWPRLAGAALALAAAIKLYPLFFALAWALRRNRPEALAFLATGAALAGLSILLAGWPLHQLFLDQVQAVGATAFANKFVWALDPLIAQLAFPDTLRFIPAPDDPAYGWQVMAKGPLWRGLSLIALLGAIAVFAKSRSGAFGWAALAVAIGLLSPISWGYHYITAIAFAPGLIGALGQRWGTLSLLVIFGPITAAALPVIEALPLAVQPLPITGTLSMVLLLAAFLIAARRAAQN